MCSGEQLSLCHSNIHVRFAIVQGMTIFAEINQETMKKILLLLAASLVLFACQKEDTEPVADGYGDVTKPVACPQCGAKYSVTCKNPDGRWEVHKYRGTDWTSHSTPSTYWEVKNEAGDNVSFDEWKDQTKIKFNCQVQDCKGVMECNRESFKTQRPTIPTI